MDGTMFQFIFLSFGIGLLIGGLTSYYVMRRSLNRNIKSITDHFKVISTQKEIKEEKSDSRRENLLLLADKLRLIENNIQKIRDRELNGYIEDLNRLLDQTGIAQIEKKN